MIPFAADVSIRNGRHREWQLWIPLAILWILLAPLVAILLPFFCIACLIGDIDPFRAIAVVWRILTSLGDTEISVNKPEFFFSVHLY